MRLLGSGNIFLKYDLKKKKQYALASDKLLCEVKITVHFVSNDVSHTCHRGAYVLAAVLLARPRRIARVHYGC